MENSQLFNDSPIATPEDDRFGFNEFSQILARSICEIKSPIGVTIALNGSWGSGKSSAVNLIKHHLKDETRAKTIVTLDFKCWWFRGEEALTLAFLQELNKTLKANIGDRVKNLLPRIGKSLLQGGAVIGPAVNLATGGAFGPIVSGSMDFTKRYFSEKKSIEELFEQLSSELSRSNKRFLIVIDDIDRLDPNETLAMFRLVKSVGRLPNIVYLLVFDRHLAEKVVKEKYPSEETHFLEKIIQVSYELPIPTRDDLDSTMLMHIESICGSMDDQERIRRFMNIYFDAIAPFIKLPRDIVRLCNALTVEWPAVNGDVNLADFIALEAMRLFEPRLYRKIRTSKNKVCGVRSSYGRQVNPEDEIKEFVQAVDESRRERARIVLMRLFPIFENVSYSHDFISEWESQRLICTEKHFDTYFKLSIGSDTIPFNDVETFIANCGSKEYVKNTLLDLLKIIRRNGKSNVPLLLDELNVNAQRIKANKFPPLISGLFEVADTIDVINDRDRGGFAIGDNNLRIHWLIRKLTFDRCTLEERDQIFMKAIKSAEIGWLVDFTRSALSNYFPREGKNPDPPEKCLVKRDNLDKLKSKALKIINEAARSGQLLDHQHLLHILFKWREFANDKGAAVKAWTGKHLTDEKSLVALARACTSESWSQGMGMFSLGDRVAVRHTRAAVDHIDDLMDVKEFREQLKRLNASRTISDDEKKDVLVFLDAWNKRDRGED